MHASRADDLSVIVVNWNAGEHLSACVRSVAAGAAGRSVELIVVDNASTDGSLDGLEAAAAPLAIRVVRNERNVGFATACNAGLERAGGRHALLLNPDARMAQGALEELVAFLDTHPGVGIAGGRLTDPSGAIERSFGRFPGLGEKVRQLRARLGGRAAGPDPSAVTAVTDVDWVSGALLGIGHVALGRGLRLDAGYPLYFEDVDLCRRAWGMGLRVVFVPRTWGIHVRGGTAPGANRRRFRRLGESRYHRRWGGPTGWLLGVAYALLAGAWRRDAGRLPRAPRG